MQISTLCKDSPDYVTMTSFPFPAGYGNLLPSAKLGFGNLRYVWVAEPNRVIFVLAYMEFIDLFRLDSLSRTGLMWF